MKVGIMQPYFFPYIGYWQLMNAVEKYVIYDDVNYINRGWINRNRILINGAPSYINLPLHGASQNKLINQIEVNRDEKKISKALSSIELAYRKAPFFNEVFPIISSIMGYNQNTVSLFLLNSFRLINDYLGINSELILSSSLKKDNTLRGQDKIIAICKCLGASDYYNAIGGKALYDYQAFKDNNMQLHFLKTNEIQYKQYKNEFVPFLSIIDVMMFNSQKTINQMLEMYTLE